MDDTSLQEINADLHDLALLAASSEARLEACCKNIEGLSSHLGAATRETALSLAQSLNTEFAHVRLALETQTAATLEEAKAKKSAATQKLRGLQGVMGSVLASTDWQSPSFLSAKTSQAGSQTGQIKGTVNDYKRDHHLDATAYEKAWRREYLDTPLLMEPTVYATSSGMAAFGTVLNAILMKSTANDTFIAGESCYFENKKLLMRLLGPRIRFVDDAHAEIFIAAIKTHRPKAVFLDSLCNSPEVTMPDIPAIVKAIGATIKEKIRVVIDNTGLASSGQFLHLIPRIWNHIELIGIESLNKYHQFGFDRVTGGIIWTAPRSTLNLFQARMHLGTNIPDASVLSLPTPDRKQLDRRLARFERNAMLVARHMRSHIDQHPDTSKLDHVAYPGLSNHAAFTRTKTSAFHGSCLVLAFKPEYQSVSVYRNFVARAIEEARKAGVELNAGTSFGFDVTRVYLTALNAKEAEKPFVRISVGTECLNEIEWIAQILIRALK